MLANTGWPAFYFAQDIARTSYLVVASMLIETLAIWFALRRRAVKAAEGSAYKANAGLSAALLTAFLANATSLLYGIALIPFSDLGVNAYDMGAIDMNVAFWVYWVPGCVIELGVIAWHRQLFNPLATLAVVGSNLLTWYLMQVVPQLPMIDLHPPG